MPPAEASRAARRHKPPRARASPIRAALRHKPPPPLPPSLSLFRESVPLRQKPLSPFPATVRILVPLRRRRQKRPLPCVKVASKPVLKLFNLSFPLASSDLGAADLENEFIKNNLHLSQVQNTIGALAAAGQDTDALEDEAFNTEAVLTGAS